MSQMWQSIQKLFSESNNEIVITPLPDDTFLHNDLDINSQSIMGEILNHISSVVINSYFRLLGGGNDELSIKPFNDKVNKIYSGHKIIVANDIWGGLFAISNGDFDGDRRSIWYFAPDLLQWVDLEINYSQFIPWICSDELAAFYSEFMWKDMNSFISTIKTNEAVLIYPFLWAKECVIETANKKIVPLMELIEINAEYKNKIN